MNTRDNGQQSTNKEQNIPDRTENQPDVHQATENRDQKPDTSTLLKLDKSTQTFTPKMVSTIVQTHHTSFTKAVLRANSKREKKN